MNDRETDRDIDTVPPQRQTQREREKDERVTDRGLESAKDQEREREI